MAEEDIKLKGYEKPSVYRGQRINDDYLKNTLNMTKDDLNKLAREQGLGSFGKDKETTKMLNKLLVDAGKEPYSVVKPIQRKLEIQLFGNEPKKTKMDRMVLSVRMEKISNAVQSMTSPVEDKVKYIKNTLQSMYPGISKSSLKESVKLFGTAALGLSAKAIAPFLSVAFSPSVEAAELPQESIKDQVMKNMNFSGPSANAQLLEQMSQDATMIKKAGGGIMNINDIIKPVGV